MLILGFLCVVDAEVVWRDGKATWKPSGRNSSRPRLSVLPRSVTGTDSSQHSAQLISALLITFPFRKHCNLNFSSSHSISLQKALQFETITRNSVCQHTRILHSQPTVIDPHTCAHNRLHRPPHGLQETNSGNFLADAVREGCDADLAIIGAGTLRADTVIPVGDVLHRDIVSLLPYADGLVVLALTGEQVNNA